MNQKPIILVIGATGAQGGSVARALLRTRKYRVRCFTRHPRSEQALELQAKGAEIIKGNLDDMENLQLAMQDCYAVFGVTNFWEHFDQELWHGKNLVDAVSFSQVRHFVFSTQPDYFKLSHGRYSVPQYDIKASLEQYARQLGIPATFIRVSFYYENFLNAFPLRKGQDGAYHFGFPQGDTKMSMVSVEDVGGVVSTILDHPEAYIGRVVGVVGEDRNCHEYAQIMSRVLRVPVHYDYIPRDQYAAQASPAAEEIANLFEVQRLYIPERQIDLIESYGLNPSMQTFEKWLLKNREGFALQEEAGNGILVQ